MLRASARHNGETVDMRGVGHETVDVGLPGGRVLSALTEAAVLRDTDEMDRARTHAVDVLGADAAARAIAVAGNFEMMNRLLDGAGVGPTAQLLPVGELIGVPLPERFAV